MRPTKLPFPILFCSLIAVTLLAAFATIAADVAPSASPAAAPLPPAPAATQPGEIRVMSFNIRYGTAKDGEDHWDKRKDLVAETIRKFNPDLLGTQETLDFQAAYLREELPGHTFVGAGRDDGKSKGEMAALFFRADRFDKLDEGHFWLSETPETPGSKSWDSSLPRITTWVKLKEKEGSKEKPNPRAGRVIYFFNTHFDHMGRTARLESAKLMRQRIAAVKDGAVVVTGDFNAAGRGVNSPEGSEPYRALMGDGKAEPRLSDSQRAVILQGGPEEGTFHSFKGGRTAARIDWILYSPHLSILDAGIDHANRDGRYPSDHYPIWARLR